MVIVSFFGCCQLFGDAWKGVCRCFNFSLIVTFGQVFCDAWKGVGWFLNASLVACECLEDDLVVFKCVCGCLFGRVFGDAWNVAR